MTPPAQRGRGGALLAKLGLDRSDVRAWALYDWAISAFQTSVQVALLPIFFVKVAAATLPAASATQRWAIANTIAALVVAIISPILGALSDVAGAKKRFLAGFALLGIAAVFGLFFVNRGDHVLAAWLYVIATVGATASFVFYESLLPHLVAPDQLDRVSTAGYAVGYIGGGLLLALNLAWVLSPATFGISPDNNLPVRLSFVSVAVWWFVFMIPLLRHVKEPPLMREPDESGTVSLLVTPFVRLGETLRSLRTFKPAFLMLLAFLVYNDGIQTIIRMATAYGTEIGIGESSLITAILIVQFAGMPFSFLYGQLAERIGAKRAVFLGLLAYAGISVIGYFMKSARDFYILAFLVSMVQGGTQALSRSLFASMIPAHKSGEFFGFYSVFEKFASVFGPLLFAIAIEQTGSSRSAILGVIAFFAIGALILSRVDVAEGRRLAQEAERAIRIVPS